MAKYQILVTISHDNDDDNIYFSPREHKVIIEAYSSDEAQYKSGYALGKYVDSDHCNPPMNYVSGIKVTLVEDQ